MKLHETLWNYYQDLQMLKLPNPTHRESFFFQMTRVPKMSRTDLLAAKKNLTRLLLYGTIDYKIGHGILWHFELNFLHPALDRFWNFRERCRVTHGSRFLWLLGHRLLGQAKIYGINCVTVVSCSEPQSKNEVISHVGGQQTRTGAPHQPL